LHLESKPKVISNSIDDINFRPGRFTNIRERIAPNDEAVLCHVSNLRAVKRPLDLVETLSRVIAAGIPAKLMLIGEGEMLPKIYERAIQLGVAQNIVVIGAQEPARLPDFIAASDLVLITSEKESFCLAALEALACGIPVVGTHCGGLDEIMRTVDPRPDRSSRLLVDVGDTDAMAKVCVELLSDPVRYDRIQRQGLSLPFSEYPRSAQANGYLTLIDDARSQSLSQASIEAHAGRGERRRALQAGVDEALRCFSLM
jgi:glycosyltransferase involved in cell wall biosynthesis